MIKITRFTAKIIAPLTEPKVRHYNGLPPQLTGGRDTRELMATPVLLLTEQESDGVSLYRFAPDGKIVGDTFHESLDDARAQARFEFGEAISDWKQVPDNVEEPFTFGMKE